MKILLKNKIDYFSYILIGWLLGTALRMLKFNFENPKMTQMEIFTEFGFLILIGFIGVIIHSLWNMINENKKDG